LVFSKPAVGRDEEFNRWYTGTHLPDMLKVEGFVEGQRFRVLKTQPKLESPSWEYVALYSLETDDIGRVMKSLNSRLGGPDLPMSDCIDIRNLNAFLAAPVTPPIRA
jgi:hypothetical protein